MRPVISSRHHPVCKLVRGLHDARGRRQHQLFVVEGGNAVSAALQARWPLQRLLLEPGEVDTGWQAIADGAGIELQPVDPAVLEYLSDTETSPGIMALAKLPPALEPDWAVEGLLLVVDGISDPGNVGTLIRAADAAGAAAVVLTENTADAYNPKVIRASAGSLFHLPPLPLAQRDPATIAVALGRQGVAVVVAEAHGGADCFTYHWPRRCALVVGHETRGPSPALLHAAAARVTIPIHGRAESLNVAAAGAVLLYAWRNGQV